MFVFNSFQILADVRLARSFTYGGYALLAWDYLLTFDDEVTYIWQSQSSVVKYLFIGSRYLNLLVGPLFISQTTGVLSLHSNTPCLVLASMVALYQLLSYGTVHSTYYHGYYDRMEIDAGRGMTIILVAVIFLYSCTLVAMIARSLRSATFTLDHTSSAGTCGTVLPSSSWLIWIVECVMEVGLFGLMIFTLRQQRCPSEFSRVSRLVRSLYRHAVIFFLANTLGDICNTVTWTLFSATPLYHISNSLPMALVSITGQRLAIDLRRLHIQKEITQSEVSREVEMQLAAFDSDPGVP